MHSQTCKNAGANTDNPSGDAMDQHSTAKGKLWTLTAAVAVFLWILITISTYILNRLSGEQISPQAPLQICKVVADAEDGTNLLTPNSGKVRISVAPVFSAVDFSTFRGWQEKDYHSRLKLNLRPQARPKLQSILDSNPGLQLAILVNQKIVGVAAPTEITPESLQLTLTFCTASDANEVFARLTQ